MHLDCTLRAGTHLGSSRPLHPVVRLRPHFRVMAGAHLVWVPYCSGDVYSGQRLGASEETYGLHFNGHHIIKAVIQDLKARHGLQAASQVLLSGESAGPPPPLSPNSEPIYRF